MCTLAGRLATLGRYPQTSSQVKLITGASRRTNASPIRQHRGLRGATARANSEPTCTGGL